MVIYDTIMQLDISKCRECGENAVEAHHIIHGTKYNKAFSEREGLMAYLCRSCHEKCHHTSAELDLKLKRDAEEKYLETHSLSDWMYYVGKNYL